MTESMTTYPVYNLEDKFRLNISQLVQDQIKHLCSEISYVEWSGILFYTINKGEHPLDEEFEISTQYIYLMDKGTSAHTAYDFTSDLINVFETIPEAINWKIAHIHSHNSMGVFFSGEDMSELNDNVGNHNFYLSLIVNNRNEMLAKVCFLASSKVKSNKILSFKDSLGKFTKKKFVENYTEEVMYIKNCDVYIPTDLVDQTFKDRIKEIIDKPNKSISTVRTQDDFDQWKSKTKGSMQYDLLQGTKETPVKFNNSELRQFIIGAIYLDILVDTSKSLTEILKEREEEFLENPIVYTAAYETIVEEQEFYSILYDSMKSFGHRNEEEYIVILQQTIDYLKDYKQYKVVQFISDMLEGELDFKQTELTYGK